MQRDGDDDVDDEDDEDESEEHMSVSNNYRCKQTDKKKEWNSMETMISMGVEEAAGRDDEERGSEFFV